MRYKRFPNHLKLIGWVLKQALKAAVWNAPLIMVIQFSVLSSVKFTGKNMTNFIPIFPLGIVAYPGEEVPLHIFEPRYIQLINDCKEGNKPFGIPAVIKEKVSEMGTLMELVDVEASKNGEMNITIKGTKVFRMLEIVKSVPGKLYSGAIVNYPQNYSNGNRLLMERVIAGIRELHTILKVNKTWKQADDNLWSYEVAHHAGLSIKEEYEILELMHELQREEYLKQHLQKVLPVVKEMEILKTKIQMNGHFKNLAGFDL